MGGGVLPAQSWWWGVPARSNQRSLTSRGPKRHPPHLTRPCRAGGQRKVVVSGPERAPHGITTLVTHKCVTPSWRARSL